MSDEADLLAQIRTNPDDDSLRSVYADVLLARGCDLGEFIHLELARARNRRAPAEQRARWLELRDQQPAWAAMLGCGELGVQWSRGLPYAIVGAPRDVIRQRQVLRELPINALVLTLKTTTDELALLPELAVIDELFIDKPSNHELEADDIAALCQSPHLTALKRLSFRPEAMRDVLVETIAAASWFDQLAMLEINRVSGLALQQLLHDERPNLKRLSIASSRLGERGAHVLANASLPGLDELILDATGMRSNLPTALTNPQIPSLRRLWLGNEDLGGVELPAFEHLVDLGLKGGFVEIAPLLARAWPTVATLDLSSNPITNADAFALAATEAFPALTLLSLMNTELTKPGCLAFAHRSGLPALRELWLGPVKSGETIEHRERTGTWSERVWHPAEEVRTWFAGTGLDVA
jgi:uncharacterized protein (TIGR02996 family)